MKRIVSIDVLRGFSLTGMVVCHFMLEYGDAHAPESLLYFIMDHALGDFGAAWFLLLVGVSQVVSGERKKEMGEINLMKMAFLRGSYVFTAGLLMGALAWGPKNMWNWDILTLIGSAYIVLYFCRFLPSWAILLMAAFIAFVTPWLRGNVDFMADWGGKFIQTPVISDYLPGILVEPVGEYEPSWRLTEMIRGFFLSGFFPIFPWLVFPLIGFVIGRRIVAKQMIRDLPFLMIIGFALIFLAFTTAYASLLRPGSSQVTDYIAPFSMFPDSNTMVYLQVGQAVLLFALMYYYYDGRGTVPRTGVFANCFKRMSRHSLTVYFVHYPLIAWPLWIIYLFTGRYPEFDLMGAVPAFLLGLAAVALFLVCLKAWERRSNKYSLEWGLSKITEGIGKPGRTS
jgi:uncharacterized membrane protein